jgi:hypothetical protein
VLLLVDTSASMAQADAGRDGQTSRFEVLRQTWLSPTFLAQLREVAKLRIVRFDDKSHVLSETQLAEQQPTGSQTFLFNALENTLKAETGSPITVLLSDGHDTRAALDGRVVEHLQKAGHRVFAVPVGQVSGVADLAVAAWAESDFLFEGQGTTLHAYIIQHGHDHERVRIELLHGNRLIDQQTITFTDEAALPVRFHVTPQVSSSSDQPVTLADYVVRVVGEDAVELLWKIMSVMFLFRFRVIGSRSPCLKVSLIGIHVI